MGWFRRKKRLLKYVKIDPPLAKADRHGFAIALCVKDEGPYIGEWALFHKAIGVRCFIVYDNGCSDDTIDVLRSSLKEEELIIVPWRGRYDNIIDGKMADSQVLAFAHAISNFGGDFKRIAFIDADEFLLPKAGKNLEESLQATCDFPNVSLPWHMFGTSGHETKPEMPVLLSYTLRARQVLSTVEHVTNFKCIIDPCEVVEVSIHQFKTRKYGDLTVNDAGFKTSRRGRKTSSFYSNTHLQLNHYYSKSRDEMTAKMARGSSYALSAQKLQEKMATTMKYIESDVIEDRSMVAFVLANKIRLDANG